MIVRCVVRVMSLVTVAVMAFALGACGNGSSASDSTSTEPAVSKPEAQAEAPPARVEGTGSTPKLHYPPKPPRHVVVRIIKEGSGPRLRPGDDLVARYIGGNPKTKLVQDFWSEENLYRFGLGENTLGKAWEIGLNGMRLGGRRELIVPSRFAYGDGMMVYIIEPLEIENRKPGRQG